VSGAASAGAVYGLPAGLRAMAVHGLAGGVLAGACVVGKPLLRKFAPDFAARLEYFSWSCTQGEFRAYLYSYFRPYNCWWPECQNSVDFRICIPQRSNGVYYFIVTIYSCYFYWDLELCTYIDWVHYRKSTRGRRPKIVPIANYWGHRHRGEVHVSPWKGPAALLGALKQRFAKPQAT
jgi:hypothetical protein